MRSLFATVVAASLLIAGQAEACAGFGFQKPFHAMGRARQADGEWRAISIEAGGYRVRVEYSDPRTPWGWLATTGSFDGDGLVFPVARGGKVPPEARVVWKTSLSEGLAEVVVTSTLLDHLNGLMWGRYSRVYNINGFECVYPGDTFDSEGRTTRHRNDICLTVEGVPVMINDASGRRIYELSKVTFRPTSGDRFRAPQGWPVTEKKPEYIRKWAAPRTFRLSQPAAGTPGCRHRR
jgi:hypothetical protein